MIKATVKFTLLFLLLSTKLWANESTFGFCEQGNRTVSVGGLISTTKVQQSFPLCTVAVYTHGTVNLATIYLDNAVPATPLSNPFTANSSGFWNFYAANGHYDVVLSGGGLPAPYTISDIQIGKFNLDCTDYNGADMGAKVANCVNALPVMGGLADCSNFTGTQTILVNVLSGIIKAVTLKFGESQITQTAPFSIADGAKVRILGNGVGHTIFFYSGSSYWFDTDTGNVVSHDDEIGNLQVEISTPALGFFRLGRITTNYNDLLLRLRWHVHDIYVTGPGCLESGCTLAAGTFGVSITELLDSVFSNITILGFESPGCIDRSGNNTWTRIRWQAYKFGPEITEKCGSGTVAPGGDQDVFIANEFLGPSSTGVAGVDYGYTVTVRHQNITFINTLYEPQPYSQGALRLASSDGVRASSQHFMDINGAFSISGAGTSNVLTTIKFDNAYYQPQFVGTFYPLDHPPISFGTPYGASAGAYAIFSNVSPLLADLVIAADPGNSKSIVIGASGDNQSYNIRAPIVQTDGILRVRCNAAGLSPVADKGGEIQYSCGGDNLLITSFDRNAGTFKPTLLQSSQVELNHGDLLADFRVVRHTLLTITTGTTPDVLTADRLLLNYAGPTTITNFINGAEGQKLTVRCANANATLQNNATLKLAGAVNFVCTANDVIELVGENGNIWYESNRSVN